MNESEQIEELLGSDLQPLWSGEEIRDGSADRLQSLLELRRAERRGLDHVTTIVRGLVVDVCKAYGVPLSLNRRAAIDAMPLVELQALRAAVRRHRRWPGTPDTPPGLREGLRVAVLDVCAVLGITLSAEQRDELDCLDVEELNDLRLRIRESRDWPDQRPSSIA